MVPLKDLFDQVEQYNGYLSMIGLGIGVICVGFIAYRLLFPPKKDKEVKL